MLADFDFAKTDRITVSELTSTDLGRLAVVTGKDNTVIGPLQAYAFSNYQVSPKLGPRFNVSVSLGDIDLHVDHKTEIWLAKS